MQSIMGETILSLSTPANVAAGMKFIEDLTRNADIAQEQVLKEILKRNANTEYLNGFLHGQANVALFKEKVPVVDYEEMQPYIERIANGDRSQILTAQPITALFKSSGTSGGRQKLFPITAEEVDRIYLFMDLSVAVLKTHIDGLEQAKRIYFISAIPDSSTPGGFVVRNAVSSLIRNKKPKNQPFNWADVLTSPDEVVLCTDVKQSMYLHLLCGLVQRDEVISVGSVFPTNFIKAIKFLEEHWEELCSNIRMGQISEWITDSNCRKAVSVILSRGMPELANAVEQECKAKSWKGIVKKLWPKTKIIETIVTGSMAQYIPILEFYCAGLPLVSMRYASSECYSGINLKPLNQPKNIAYTLMPNMAYFEFLPVDQSSVEETQNRVPEKSCTNSGIVDLASVNVGQQYELVVTTFSGLYRCRVGDIFMVTGFHNKAPQFQFVRRKNIVLSIDIDKTTEEDLFIAVTKAMQILEPYGFLLQDYTSYSDTSSVPGHYVLFWELQSKESTNLLTQLDAVELEKCCASVEQSLDAVYRMVRKWENTIDPLEIRVVKKGTFEALMEFFVSQGSSGSQYKTPKSIKSDKALEILNSMVVGRYYSRIIPN